MTDLRLVPENEEVMIPPWHHGGIDWSCCTNSHTPLSDFGPRRLEDKIQNGVNKGRTGIHAPCPLCKAEGRLTWIRIGVKQKVYT
jgi:hypothetical protein